MMNKSLDGAHQQDDQKRADNEHLRMSSSSKANNRTTAGCCFSAAGCFGGVGKKANNKNITVGLFQVFLRAAQGEKRTRKTKFTLQEKNVPRNSIRGYSALDTSVWHREKVL
eukprot:GABV01015157.1.p1 GENE.GABV01015157.1~~GABV01015157.1.p1  ORF type:complete len:112 (+),score=16.01 GABV01015157.1:78-413(+)